MDRAWEGKTDVGAGGLRWRLRHWEANAGSTPLGWMIKEPSCASAGLQRSADGVGEVDGTRIPMREIA